MKKHYFYQFILFLLINLFNIHASFAWNHSIELGYGRSHDPNHSHYTNSGFLLSGDLFSLGCNCWSHWSINGELGQWYTTTPRNKNLTTAALALALRLYPFRFGCFPSYVLASAGPAYLSHQKFGWNTQASHLTIATNIGLGIELNQLDLNLRMAHFSNANLAQPNDGFNVQYLFSIGYLF